MWYERCIDTEHTKTQIKWLQNVQINSKMKNYEKNEKLTYHLRNSHIIHIHSTSVHWLVRLISMFLCGCVCVCILACVCFRLCLSLNSHHLLELHTQTHTDFLRFSIIVFTCVDETLTQVHATVKQYKKSIWICSVHNVYSFVALTFYECFTCKRYKRYYQ